MRSLGASIGNTMLVEYLKTLDTTLKANTDNMFELPADAKADTITNEAATAVVRKVQEIVRNYRTGITEYRVGLPSDQIKLLASYEFIDIYANALAVLGHKPEFIQSKYVEGAKTLQINGVELIPF